MNTFGRKIEENNQFDQERKQPEGNLYGLNISNEERKVMNDFNHAKEFSDKKKVFKIKSSKNTRSQNGSKI